MPEGSELCQEAKTRLETDRWSTSGKEVEPQWPMPNKHPTPIQTHKMSQKNKTKNKQRKPECKQQHSSCSEVNQIKCWILV